MSRYYGPDVDGRDEGESSLKIDFVISRSLLNARVRSGLKRGHGILSGQRESSTSLGVKGGVE